MKEVAKLQIKDRTELFHGIITKYQRKDHQPFPSWNFAIHTDTTPPAAKHRRLTMQLFNDVVKLSKGMIMAVAAITIPTIA